MKQLLTALFALAVSLTCPANVRAADLGEADSVFHIENTTSVWNRAYFGLHAGWTENNFERDPTVDAKNIFNENYTSDDWLLGAQIGTQRQFGSLVLGLEIDASWIDTEGGTSVDAGTLTLDHSTSINWLTTARARLGLPLNKTVMPYVTGGVAFARVTERLTITETENDPIHASLPDDIRFGWAYGGGIDINLGKGWTGSFEYLRVDFNDSSIAAASGDFEAGFDAQNHMDTFNLKVSHRF